MELAKQHKKFRMKHTDESNMNIGAEAVVCGPIMKYSEANRILHTYIIGYYNPSVT